MTIAPFDEILAADVIAVQTAANAALSLASLAVPLSQAGLANGYCQLDQNGNIPLALLTSSLVNLMSKLGTTLPGTSLTLYLNGLTLSISSQS